MRAFILVLLCLTCFLHCSAALEGKPLYDYMVLFLNTYWYDAQYQKMIESLLNSRSWKTLDAQYGPWGGPPVQKK